MHERDALVHASRWKASGSPMIPARVRWSRAAASREGHGASMADAPLSETHAGIPRDAYARNADSRASHVKKVRDTREAHEGTRDGCAFVADSRGSHR